MRYDSKTIALHWATVALVLILWTIGQTADMLPRGPWRGAYWSLHFFLGFVFVAVLLLRIFWRSGRGTRLPPADKGILRTLAISTHYLLYALLVIVALLGIANAFAHGVSIFGLIKLPRLADHAVAESLTDIHGQAANGLLAIAALHAAAALVHHYLWRDSVLERMMPGDASRLK